MTCCQNIMKITSNLRYLTWRFNISDVLPFNVIHKWITQFILISPVIISDIPETPLKMTRGRKIFSFCKLKRFVRNWRRKMFRKCWLHRNSLALQIYFERCASCSSYAEHIKLCPIFNFCVKITPKTTGASMSFCYVRCFDAFLWQLSRYNSK